MRRRRCSAIGIPAAGFRLHCPAAAAAAAATTTSAATAATADLHGGQWLAPAAAAAVRVE